MLLRRVIEHVKTQNWTAVGLDFIIVVVGVFMGIQLGNWNDARGDRAETLRYYEQLLLDLEQDLETADTALRIAGRNDASGDLVYAAITEENFTVDEPADLARAFLIAGYGYIPEATTQTIDELTSTGNLRLLGDIELKRAIMRYYAGMKSLRQWDAGIRQTQAEYDDAATGLLSRTQLREVRRAEMTVSEDEVIAIVERARQREELSGAVTAMAEVQQRLRRDSMEMRSSAEELIALIEAKLEIRK